MAYIQEIKEADLTVCEKANSFLQSSMWGEFKSRFGWNAKAFLINWQNDEIQESLPLLVLCRRLLPGFSFAYVPWGPELPAVFSYNDKPHVMTELAKKLKPFLARNTVFIRFEPPWVLGATLTAPFIFAGLKKAAATVQAPDTVIIDLTPSNEEILARMKPKWRYNVQLAGKKGVQVKTHGVNEIELFYNLLKETALRDGISVHSINYYKTLFETCADNKIDIRLYIANHEEDILAAIVVLFRGKEATYLYGASSNNKRNLMAPYALQWQAMRDAKEAGCLSYDLFGIPPNEDPNHPMAGLYRFKTGFGGQIIHRTGGWDYSYKPVVYKLFNLAEGLRKKVMDLRKKK